MPRYRVREAHPVTGRFLVSVDGLGRLVIPAEIRRAFGIVAGTPLRIDAEGGALVLRPPAERCPSCGRPKVGGSKGGG